MYLYNGFFSIAFEHKAMRQAWKRCFEKLNIYFFNIRLLVHQPFFEGIIVFSLFLLFALSIDCIQI